MTKVVLSRLKTRKEAKCTKDYIISGLQGLHNFRDSTTKNCKDQAVADLKSLDEHMRAHFEWSDVDLMRLIFLFLDTQSWQDSARASSNDDGDCLSEAVISITDVLRAPFDAKSADHTSIVD